MKFLFSDSMDMVDPDYDFLSDRSAPSRRPYWGDQYPHELLGYAPYDGMLVSRAVVGNHLKAGKYTASQSMRFMREGARKFLRLNGPKFKSHMLMGDNGAFSYLEAQVPPYSTEDTIEFYRDGQFTHGCSVDHIILEYSSDNIPESEISNDVRNRYSITLANAEDFHKLTGTLPGFTPVGVVQGWSPASMASAALLLEKMGYRYIAVGGLVPLKSEQIHECLRAIRSAISPVIKIHLLGFAKAEQIHEFIQYNITSFDSTSPFIRAFKDARANYYVQRAGGGIDYYSAIRIPQATANPRLMRAVKRGTLRQEDIVKSESRALKVLREYDCGKAGLSETLDAIIGYIRLMLWDPQVPGHKIDAEIDNNILQVSKTLSDRPWKSCKCSICRHISVEVVVFRASNRNKRRGFHNLAIYFQHLQNTRGVS